MGPFAHVWHEIAVWLGITNLSDPQYGFWSGVGSDLIYISAFGVLYRHLNCHVTGCRRLGFHHVHGTSFKVCRKHHPDGGNTVEAIHKAAA